MHLGISGWTLTPKSHIFSKFLLPDSVVIESKINGTDPSLLESVAVQNTADQTVLVVHNRGSETYQAAVKDVCLGVDANVLIEPNSITTLVWNQPNGACNPTSLPASTKVNPTSSAASSYQTILLWVVFAWFCFEYE